MAKKKKQPEEKTKTISILFSTYTDFISRLVGFMSGFGCTHVSISLDDKDEYFIYAGKFVIESDKGSIGMLQRKFKIGFNRAARIMDQLAEAGVVGEEEGTKPRKVLMYLEQFEQYIEDYL